MSRLDPGSVAGLIDTLATLMTGALAGLDYYGPNRLLRTKRRLGI